MDRPQTKRPHGTGRRTDRNTCSLAHKRGSRSLPALLFWVCLITWGWPAPLLNAKWQLLDPLQPLLSPPCLYLTAYRASAKYALTSMKRSCPTLHMWISYLNIPSGVPHSPPLSVQSVSNSTMHAWHLSKRILLLLLKARTPLEMNLHRLTGWQTVNTHVI